VTLASETLTVKGRTAEILTAGKGEPLVFLHGGGIIEGFDFLEPLSHRFRVVAPLRPGYGGTDIDPPLTSRDEVVAYFADVLDELGIERTVLVGHSLGGWLSATFAANYPERVSELILASPFGMNLPSPNLMAMTPAERFTALTNNPDVWIGRVPTGDDPEFAAARQREMESMGRFMTGPFDPQLPELLTRITAPVELLWGDDDGTVPFAHAPAWQEALPDAPLKVFEGTGHLLFHETRAAVDAIPEFVDSSRA
jgi:pimeloyl-ACP methyl ester carboxylesterase